MLLLEIAMAAFCFAGAILTLVFAVYLAFTIYYEYGPPSRPLPEPRPKPQEGNGGAITPGGIGGTITFTSGQGGGEATDHIWRAEEHYLVCGNCGDSFVPVGSRHLPPKGPCSQVCKR